MFHEVPYLTSKTLNPKPKLKKTIASSNQCCAGIRNYGNPSLVKISSDFPSVF